MKQFISAFFVLILFVSFGQGTYTTVDDIELTGNGGYPAHFERPKYDWFWSLISSPVTQFANVWASSVQNEAYKAQYDRELQAASSQLAILKRTYESVDQYPEKITDGWHKAMATDNLKFCKELKVYVLNNKINKLVIDNCIPLNATAFGTIKNGMGSVAISQGENGETLMTDVYFLFDLEEPFIVSEPIRPGYVSFWTNVENFETAEIYINNNKRLPSFTRRFSEEPDCFTPGMSNYALPPGTYYYKVERRGADWDGSIEIKPGMCLKIPLIEEERTGPPRPGQRN